MPRIFISRDLEKDSVFRRMLASEAIEIIDLSLVAFRGLPFGELPAADYWFFYSKNGVKFFFDQYSCGKDMPKIATIGPGTAQYLAKNYQLKADWVGNGDPEETAAAFATIVQGQKVLFIQAKHSRQSVQQLLGETIQSDALVVYDNCVKSDFDIPKVDVLVFTSPMNVKAYFGRYSYEGQGIICIGHTTAKALRDYQIDNYLVAVQPSEAALAKACQEWIERNKNV